MRIIKGNDYYDGCLAYGRDPNLIFVRQGEEYTGKILPKPFDFLQLSDNMGRLKYLKNHKNVGFSYYSMNYEHHIFYKNEKYKIYCHPYKIWIAGISYKGLKLCINNNVFNIWNELSLNKELEKMGLYYCDMPSKWRLFSINTNNIFEGGNNDDLKFMLENKYTIMTLELMDFQKLKLIIDGDNLKKFDFQKIMDPYRAYQEIAMWLGNLPKEGAPMIMLDNKTKIEKHGFDFKTSFRGK